MDFDPGSGSSPHTRGAPPWRQLVAERCGIIPAYAGSTAALASQAHSIADHPRIRGEHRELPVHSIQGLGSSPHTRGAPRSVSHITLSARIIPAYAGSTGGNIMPVENVPGSSPHTRGALGLLLRVAVGDRIIPAYAGSTRCCLAVGVRWWDHPRIRGEHAMSTYRLQAYPDHPRIRGEHPPRQLGSNDVLGSSPHTRGALA